MLHLVLEVKVSPNGKKKGGGGLSERVRVRGPP